jgi:hypothetical protein
MLVSKANAGKRIGTLMGDFTIDKIWSVHRSAPLAHSHEMAGRSSHLRSLKPHGSAL